MSTVAEYSRYVAANIGGKFNQDGTVRVFPGNTIISKIDDSMKIYQELCGLVDKLLHAVERTPFSWLPASSYHMTVIEGVCDQNRREGYWTSLLSLDTPLDDVDALFKREFAKVQQPTEIRMRWKRIQLGSALTVRLEPATEESRAQLVAYRNDVSQRLGIRFPNHDDYGFHISLAYLTSTPTEEEANQIDRELDNVNQYIEQTPLTFSIRQPQLCFFKDMFDFSPTRLVR
ncbi:DUF1868 domain-containing protein [Ruminococcaceae bacterium OttesenSCG-928-L11]|nr:DUF1868 domain-containing protein [Ruminococcaceae bacterium OttesenSCG-928-L11]